MSDKPDSMLRLTRFYAIASFVGMLGATAILSLFFRQLAIQDIISLSQNTNVNLAQTAVNWAREELYDYLSKVEDVGPHEPIEAKLSSPIALALRTLMRDTSVVRFKIYNRRGTVVYSTKLEQIGDAQEENEGLSSALAGHIRSELIYRDTFNRFDRETEEDNLMQTYMPVRDNPTSPIKGSH